MCIFVLPRGKGGGGGRGQSLVLLPPPSPSPLPLGTKGSLPRGWAALVPRGRGEGEGGGKLPFIIRTELCILASLLWVLFCCTCWAAKTTPWPKLLLWHQYSQEYSNSTAAVLNQYSNSTPTVLMVGCTSYRAAFFVCLILPQY